MTTIRFVRRVAPLSALLPAMALAQGTTLEQVIITAPQMADPLTVITDPKAPRQPLPAHDGADYLKTIPGFNVIRKGGTDGDPVFRGMAASRLNIVLDGEHIFGGCGGRMDPPTAYVYPESYDRVTVIKGPQTVLHGPGNSAATVLFERDPPRFDEPGREGYGSALLGSFGRNDQVLGLSAGDESYYVRGGATRSDMNDYRDGDGTRVHSRYTRWSADLAVGWTPDADTLIELSTARSDGEAAYADRMMDGTLFERTNWGLKAERRNLSALIDKVEGQVYYNYVDHVMDNYSMRSLPPMGMMANKRVGNPDRETTGLRMTAELLPGGATLATIGVDHRRDVHSARSSQNQDMDPYQLKPRMEDARFSQTGLFGEVEHDLNARNRIIGGLRVDWWEAEDRRRSGPTAGETRDKTLTGGFVRQEHDLGTATLLYAGLGHVQRFPDYWELISQGRESETTGSAFHTRPEHTTQIDVGLIHASGPWHTSVSGFINRIDDFILIDTRFPGKEGTMVSRNIDASTWGAEAGLAWSSGPWKLDGTLAYVRGENDTDNVPLAQIPPLEVRLGAEYTTGAWSLGALVRVVADQNRVDVGAGNIVGQDIDETDGFTVVSINGSYRLRPNMLLAAGIDNLFDETYAEHISRAGFAVPGFEQTTRVNEPGRNLWASLKVDF
ncbi:TonB-dependent copper receptor [Thioalkalivibrio thiocyanodenitrificans]|uniref:TonB-dependent copper receptor n=1 Tax=Thioalkalivibrio thiocyanodenitrificans TaxID=243063 RepID=UPI0003A9BEFB|nr:TonB-dependent copper receptor [Thioalkalivibrio thiocyanodenitrificans]